MDVLIRGQEFGVADPERAADPYEATRRERATGTEMKVTGTEGLTTDTAKVTGTQRLTTSRERGTGMRRRVTGTGK